MTYEEAIKARPPGACYCDLTDRECYDRGHWKPLVSEKLPEAKTLTETDG